MSKLEWREELDDYDNSYYEADSIYEDDGRRFKWRLRQRLEGNRIQWYADHTEELMPEFDGETWDTLKEAKMDIQRAHENTLADV